MLHSQFVDDLGRIVRIPYEALVDVGHRLEAENGENDDARVNRGEGVTNADQDHVPDAVVVRRVVRTERDQRAER